MLNKKASLINKIIKNNLLIICGLLIIFYISLFQGKTLVSVAWPVEIVKAKSVTINYYRKKDSNGEVKKYSFYVFFDYFYQGKKRDGSFNTKSKLFYSDDVVFKVRINPKNPNEFLFDQPAWTTIIIFFLIAIFLIGIGIVNIIEAIWTPEE